MLLKFTVFVRDHQTPLVIYAHRLDWVDFMGKGMTMQFTDDRRNVVGRVIHWDAYTWERV